MSAVQQLVILGATGSIGLSTLDVVARNQQQFKVFALTAGQNAKKMAYYRTYTLANPALRTPATSGTTQ